ncbi:MAG: hypothetical protein HY074_20095 [Deltaproteobacteria bacterium]|nr:hypothetical protein [Deltaproteobacteria bacterium]
MSKSVRAALLALVVVIAGSGCASGPKLDNYPRSQIDRPYTLPNGVNAWHIIAPMIYARDNDGSFFFPPVPIPLVWRQSLTDDWALLWTPVPTVQHQFLHTKTDVIGATLGYNIGYGSVNGVSAGPVLNGTHRHNFSEKLALETNANFSANYYGRTQVFNWSTGLTSGPFFQVSPLMALGPRTGLAFEHGYYSNYAVTSKIAPSASTRVTVPLGFWWQYSFSRQWEMTMDYNYLHIGYDNGFYSHVALLSFIHTW